MQKNQYVIKSLELHLFFGRIMKEHAFFLRAGFTPADAAFANQAEYYKSEFDKLLCQAVMLSGGMVSQPVLCSGEIVTEFTARAEEQTEKFTGIPINHEITARELRMGNNGRCCGISEDRYRQVQQLNQKAIQLLDGLISFKETVLHNVLCCEMFTMNYPLLIEHIIREAKLYRSYAKQLEEDGCLAEESMKKVECFWNRIMMEHAMFIRGLLDPSEAGLIENADGFAKEFAELLESCCEAQEQTLQVAQNHMKESLGATLRLRDFKMAGTQGIEQCKIRSVILPLLADHVLREANHYIRLLKC